MTTVPWYIDLTLLFFPLAVSTITSLWLNVTLRKINRQEGGKPWSIKKNFIMALLIASPMAGIIQLLLQGQLEAYIYIENGAHMIGFDMIMAPFLVLMLNNILLWYFNKKKWVNAYSFLRVKHDKTLPPEYYADDVSDFTIKNFRQSNLNGNNKDAE